MSNVKAALVSTAVALALVATPLSSASAHGRHGGIGFGLAAAGAAVVVGTAALLTAPFRAAAYSAAPPYYAPPPPAYYAPPQAYYAPPPAYYGPPPGYYAPPAYAPAPYAYGPGYSQGYYGPR